MSLRSLLSAVLACCSFCVGVSQAQEAVLEPRPEAPGELVVEVANAEGQHVAEVDPDSLEVVLGDETRPVNSVEPLAGPWRVVLYFDQLLTPPLAFRAAAFELAERAPALVTLGPVEIVLAGETTRVTLPGTESAQAVAEALGWLRLRESAEAGQHELRRRFIEEFRLAEIEEVAASDRAERVAELGAGVRRAVQDEATLLGAQRRKLVRWLAENDGPGRELLVLVSGGFDADPVVFYRTALGGGKLANAVSGLESPQVAPGLEEVGRTLAVYGWTVLPFRPAATRDPLVAASEEEERRRREEERVGTVSQSGSLDTPRTVGSVDVGRLFGRRRGEEPAGLTPALLDPDAPLRELARVTGGELVEDGPALAAALGRLPGRWLLRYDSYLPAGGPPARVSVRAIGGEELRVRSRQWAGRTTTEAVAAVRAERVFNSEEGEGELAIEAALAFPEEGSSGGLAVRLDEPPGGDPEAPLRVSVAVDREDGSVEVRHYEVGGDGGQRAEFGPDGEQLVTLPLFFHSEATVVAVVEDLRTGRWGAAFAEESLEGVVPTADDSLFLPAPKAIHLMAPREAMVMGRTNFETVVSEHRVARVEFFIDGERVSVSNAPPFSAVVDLGKLPEPHEIEAVAYGEAGEELDRDRLTVNEGTGSFRVRIVDPRSEAQRRGGALLVGNVDVEVEVKVPRGARLERLEYYWQDRLVGTRYADPYLHRIRIPADEPRGFLRVLGVLDDGATSEDVLVVNTPGSSERLEVDLVELYVVVSDRQGRPLRDLDRDKFRVLEEGVPQPLSNFGDAGDLPLTVGLAIDSSASMFVKLPEVQAAAATYLRGLTTRKDRAFVVGFGNEPRLARDTTADLGQVVTGLYRLEPDGQTAIWKAVVYSLVQLQGVPGKKALIVYSDGADEDPDFSYKTALRFAQRVGVPVYFIVANDEIYRTGGKSLNIRSFLGRLRNLSQQVGGRVFLTRVDADLSEIYEEIDRELRSQYLLGYYPTRTSEGGWRPVEVEVDVPGARARTISGYYR